MHCFREIREIFTKERDAWGGWRRVKRWATQDGWGSSCRSTTAYAGKGYGPHEPDLSNQEDLEAWLAR